MLSSNVLSYLFLNVHENKCPSFEWGGKNKREEEARQAVHKELCSCLLQLCICTLTSFHSRVSQFICVFTNKSLKSESNLEIKMTELVKYHKVENIL